MIKRIAGVMFVCMWVLCIGVPLPAQAGDNLLRNPGFEKVGRDGVPVGWTREYNKKLTGPFMVVRNAHQGKRAICLLTEEWNYQRPQFITQTVKLPAGAKGVRLSAYCKGQGLVQFDLLFMKDGKPVETSKVQIGAMMKSHVVPKSVRLIAALEQAYREYEISPGIPEGANEVLVKIGNSVDKLTRLNIWGKAWIDTVALDLTRRAPPAAAISPAEQFVDVAPYALVFMQPASFNPRAVIDDDVKTAYSHMGGLERASNINFVFPVTVPVTSIQLYLRAGVADRFTVRGDSDGDGLHEVLLAREEVKTDGWVNLNVPRTRVKGIRVQAIRGKRMYSGYRGTYPFATEVRILAPADSAPLEELAKNSAFKHTYPLEKGVKKISQMLPVEITIPKLEKTRFRKMVCGDLWMWGVQAGKKDSKIPDLKNNKGFRRNVDTAKSMGVDTILIDLTNSSCRDLMPWPSKVCNGTDNNILKPTIEALHAEGLKVIVEIIHNITPFETIKWHYPEEETSRYPGMKQHPSIIHGDHVKKNWLVIMDEIMACGADGVGISSDEQYYKGHFMETFPKDDPGRALYKKRFGHELPGKEEDTLAFRQWIIMRHEGICDLFGNWIKELKKKYPQIYTNTMLMSYAHAYSFITETGVPVDMLGARAGITEIGSDYMGPYGIGMAAAANGWRKATMLHNGDMWPYPPLSPIHFYGTTLWNVMYGAGSVNYWRLNYVTDNGHAPALTRAYAMAGDLEALGVWEARPPKKIALLSSRAGLDWWQIKAWWGKHDDPNWDRGLEGQRGWFADETAFNMLQKNGYSFAWHFLDQPGQLDDLEDYKVLIAPFAYSVSKTAAARVQAAVAKGAKLILLDGQAGPTDEWGEPHPAPVFKDLADSGQAILFKEDILQWGSTDRFQNKVLSTIDNILGDENPLKLNRYNHHVDATLLQKAPRELFVFIINWENKSFAIDLGVSVPEGKYEILVRDETQWRRAALAGRTAPDHADLKKFRLYLGNKKPYVLYIRPAR